MPHTQTNSLSLLASADAARILERTPAAVRGYARDGKLPIAAVTPGGQRLFRIEDVRDLKRQLEERE